MKPYKDIPAVTVMIHKAVNAGTYDNVTKPWIIPNAIIIAVRHIVSCEKKG